MHTSASRNFQPIRDLAVLATAALTLTALASGCASPSLPVTDVEPRSGPAARQSLMPVSDTESTSTGRVQLKSGTLTLNGNLKTADDAQPGQIILMVHGTLAHNGMEIMQAFQERFADLGLNSLAITLSLGVDNRQGMFGCDQPHRHLHTDAITEIRAWYEWLATQGYSRISILGHSRGGNQVALFSQLKIQPVPEALILIAPMTVTTDEPGHESAIGTEPGTLIETARQKVSATGQQQLMSVPGFLHCAESKVSPQTFLSYYNPRAGMSGDNNVELIMSYEPDTPTLLKTTILPTLVIAGSEDRVSADLQSRIEARPNIRVFEIDGADHFFRDLYADDAAEEIASFIESIRIGT